MVFPGIREFNQSRAHSVAAGRPLPRPQVDEPVHHLQGAGDRPQAYLRDALDRISTHPAKRIDELLPDRWQELRPAGDAAPD
jgi:hypothetical protein